MTIFSTDHIFVSIVIPKWTVKPHTALVVTRVTVNISIMLHWMTLYIEHSLLQIYYPNLNQHESVGMLASGQMVLHLSNERVEKIWLGMPLWNTFALSYILALGHKRGKSSGHSGGREKSFKYSELGATYTSMVVAIETSGIFGYNSCFWKNLVFICPRQLKRRKPLTIYRKGWQWPFIMGMLPLSWELWALNLACVYLLRFRLCFCLIFWFLFFFFFTIFWPLTQKLVS